MTSRTLVLAMQKHLGLNRLPHLLVIHAFVAELFTQVFQYMTSLEIDRA